MVKHPCKYPVGILQRRGILEFRSQAISKIYNCKSPARQVHTIVLVSLLIAVYPAAAMDAHDNRERPFLLLKTVYIENLPSCILSIDDIIITQDSLWGGKTGIPPVITFLK